MNQLKREPFIGGADGAQLRKILNIMFPPSYIELYHRPPNSVCTLLNTRSWPPAVSQDQSSQSLQNEIYLEEASTEPSSRASFIRLREQLNSSLTEHQAKLVGLCPIRRSIYDQCFDELIRQVTVGCVEQGLLLFRVRNELRMTINYYRRAYESGVEFGLRKAIESEMTLASVQGQMQQLDREYLESDDNAQLRNRTSEFELKNKLESVDRMKDYFYSEMAKRDQVIEQQRAIIKALSQKFTSDIRSPV